MGVRDRRNTSEGQALAVTGIALHPQFFSPTTGEHTHHAFYDVAVMFVSPHSTLAPAKLGTASDFSSEGTALGWGHYDLDHDKGLFDPRLKAINLNLGNDEFCDEWINQNGETHYFPAIHICGFDYEGDDCITHGDSGGPLVVGETLIGVTSFFPATYSKGPCKGLAMVGFAWAAGPTLRDWILTVPHPPVKPIVTPVNQACVDAQAGLGAAQGTLRKAQRKLRKASGRGAKRRARRRAAKARRRAAAWRAYTDSVCP